jgi:D-3-phosphoglycerate dehydrogenase
VVTRKLPDTIEVRMRELFDTHLNADDKPMSQAELVEAVKTADVLVPTVTDTIDDVVIGKAGDQLKLIANFGNGVDNIDVAAAEAEGVRVMNTPSASSTSVAELALALMFSLARQIPRADQSMKSGAWDKKTFAKGMELEGKTLGILGVGRIGRALARKASALGMVVIGADPALGATGSVDGLTLLPPDDVFRRADFISLHLPKVAGTPATLGRDQFAQMKNGVFVVNCARGGVVDEAALLAALESGKVAGCALDVFEVEPPGSDHPLLALPNVIATPHVGGNTHEVASHLQNALGEMLHGEAGNEPQATARYVHARCFEHPFRE